MAAKSRSANDTVFDRRRSDKVGSASNPNSVPARRSSDGAHPASAKPRATRDGRQPLVVYMRPEAIKALKFAALEDDTTASAIVAMAVSSWLDARSRHTRLRETRRR